MERPNEEGSVPKKNAVLVIIVIALLVIAGFAVYYFLIKEEEKETIKIGAILSLTGTGGTYGVAVRNGMELAISELNSQGGLNGRELEMILEDSKTELETARNAFDSIEKEQEPLLYVSTLSFISINLAQKAKENQVVLMGLITSAPELTENNPYCFRYWPIAEQECVPVIKSFTEKQAKDIGIIYLNDEYGNAIVSEMDSRWTVPNGSVTAVRFNSSQTEFDDLIKGIENKDAIYVVGFTTHIKAILTTLRENNYAGIIGTTNSATLPANRENPIFEGVYTSSPAIYNPDYLFAKETSDKFKEKFGVEFDHYSAIGYDFIYILYGLLEDEEVSRDNVRELLEGGFIHPGVFGDIDKKDGEHDICFPYYSARIENGEVEYLRDR